MGEKKMKDNLRFADLAEVYGWSESFFRKNSHILEPALIKFNGRARKPFTYAKTTNEFITSTLSKFASIGRGTWRELTLNLSGGVIRAEQN